MIVGTADNAVGTMTDLLNVFELLIDAKRRACTSLKHASINIKWF